MLSEPVGRQDVGERLGAGRPVRMNGREVHQVGLPYHWGTRGLTTGGSANDLTHMALDPNVHIQEVKALSCDIRPGRRARGKHAPKLVER